jgi:hypothetical protein
LENEISFSCPATQSQKYPGNFLEIMQNTNILEVMQLSGNQKVYVLNPSAGKLLALKKAQNVSIILEKSTTGIEHVSGIFRDP